MMSLSPCYQKELGRSFTVMPKKGMTVIGRVLIRGIRDTVVFTDKCYCLPLIATDR
jgi:hypothetical protein